MCKLLSEFSCMHLVIRLKIRQGADAHTRVIVLLHLKAVFIFTAAVNARSVLCFSPESHFLRFPPSFLSEKSEVICKYRPFQPTQVHADVSSDDYGSAWFTHTCIHVLGFNKGCKKHTHYSENYVSAKLQCPFMWRGGDAFLYLMCSITSLFYFNLSLYVFRRGEAVLSVPGQELHAPNVCLHQCVSACFL